MFCIHNTIDEIFSQLIFSVIWFINLYINRMISGFLGYTYYFQLTPSTIMKIFLSTKICQIAEQKILLSNQIRLKSPILIRFVSNPTNITQAPMRCTRQNEAKNEISNLHVGWFVFDGKYVLYQPSRHTRKYFLIFVPFFRQHGSQLGCLNRNGSHQISHQSQTGSMAYSDRCILSIYKCTWNSHSHTDIGSV